MYNRTPAESAAHRSMEHENELKECKIVNAYGVSCRATGFADSGEAALLAVHRSPDSLPTCVASSIKRGTVSQDQLQQYMQLEQHQFIRYLLYCPGAPAPICMQNR